MWRVRDGRRGVRLSQIAAASKRARVLLLASPLSYRVAAYLKAAATLGIDLTVASNGRNSIIPALAGGLHIDFAAPREATARVLAEARRRPFRGIVPTDDATVELASRVAAALGLPHNSVRAARLSRRKDLAREALRRAGLPAPRFRRLDLRAGLSAQCRGLRYPCVIKPLALSGSRGVMRADDPGELVAAAGRLRNILREVADEEERGYALVEEFLPGREVAVEGMLHGGRLQVLAVFDKPDPLDGPFFEETYYITPSRLDAATRARVERRVGDAAAAYGLREGPLHAELRVCKGDAWLIELAARTIGGSCGRLIRLSTGLSLEELVLMRAIGRTVDVTPARNAAGVLMIPIPRAGTLRRIEGVLEARTVPLVEDLQIAVREGYELVPLPEGSSYLGFIFARGPAPAPVEQALRAAHARLRVVVAPMWRLRPAPSDATSWLLARESPPAASPDRPR